MIPSCYKKQRSCDIIVAEGVSPRLVKRYSKATLVVTLLNNAAPKELSNCMFY